MYYFLFFAIADNKYNIYKAYYRKAAGALIVFDITNQASFRSIYIYFNTAENFILLEYTFLVGFLTWIRKVLVLLN